MLPFALQYSSLANRSNRSCSSETTGVSTYPYFIRSNWSASANSPVASIISAEEFGFGYARQVTRPVKRGQVDVSNASHRIVIEDQGAFQMHRPTALIEGRGVNSACLAIQPDAQVGSASGIGEFYKYVPDLFHSPLEILQRWLRAPDRYGMCAASQLPGQFIHSGEAPRLLLCRRLCSLAGLGPVLRGRGEVQVWWHVEAKLRDAEVPPFRRDLAEDKAFLANRIGHNDKVNAQVGDVIVGQFLLVGCRAGGPTWKAAQVGQ